MRKALLLFMLFTHCLKPSAQISIKKATAKIMAAQKDFSGVVLLANNGKTIFHKAYGKRDFNKTETVRKNDIFELASVSKQFTAAIIIMLKQDGRLQYDDLVEKHLSIPYTGITIRHLLNHTSGLPDYQAIMDKYWDKSRAAGNADIIAYLHKYAPPVRFLPGERFEYSNTGYVLLASIAEKVSGQDFLELCRNRIFRPLGMRHTDIRSLTEKAAVENFAKGHVFVKEKGRFMRADSFPSSDYTIWLGNRKGPGRVSSRAKDLLLWDQALYGNEYLSEASKTEAFTPGKLNDKSQTDYGFGWFIHSIEKGDPVIWHDGDNPGYKTIFRRYPASRQTIIILSNNYYDGFDQLVKSLEGLITRNHLGR